MDPHVVVTRVESQAEENGLLYLVTVVRTEGIYIPPREAGPASDMPPDIREALLRWLTREGG